MSESDFKRKIEPWCHFISIVQPIIASVFLLAKQSLNFEGKVCYISPYPRTCLQSDNIECERGSKRTRLYALWLSGAPILLVFTIVAINMIIIIVTVIAQKKKSDRWRWSNNDGDAYESFLMRTLTCCCKDSLKSYLDNEIQDSRKTTQSANRSTLRKPVKTTSKHSVDKSFKKKEVTFSETEKVLTFNKSKSDSSLVKFAKNEITTMDEEKNDEEMILRTASLIAKPKAPPSRSGTFDDPYAFDIYRVRKSIRRESLALSKKESSTTVNASNKSNNIDDIINNNGGPRIKSNEEEAAIRALLYIVSYIVCYLPPAIATYMKFNRNEDEPFGIALLTRIMLPLQGFLFIMVYTRPFVLSLRKSNPEYSRIKAFWMVIRSGGDKDEVVVESRRNLSDASPMTDERRKELQERIRENWRRSSVSIPAATSSAVDV